MTEVVPAKKLPSPIEMICYWFPLFRPYQLESPEQWGERVGNIVADVFRFHCRICGYTNMCMAVAFKSMIEQLAFRLTGEQVIEGELNE